MIFFVDKISQISFSKLIFICNSRTLCIPPFFKHKTDELNQSIAAKLRIDKEVLSKFVSICTEEEIPTKCPKVSALWMGSSNIACGLPLQKRYNVFIQMTKLEQFYSVSFHD
jgi:hypothetical protein